MPVTKESEHAEAENLDQTKDDKSSAVKQSSEEKILEKELASEINEKLVQEDTIVPREQIRDPPSEQRQTGARDDAGVVEKSEIADSNIVRPEICITMTDAPSESQQLEGIIQTIPPSFLGPSGDGFNSPDITTSTISITTQSEQDVELDTLPSQGSNLLCRSCKNMYTQNEDKPASCSDLCPFCKATTYSPLRPKIPQPQGNPVKNQNIDTPPEIESEDDTQFPAVQGGVMEPERPSNKSPPPPPGSPPNASSPSPEVVIQMPPGETQGETQQNQQRDVKKCCCNSDCKCICHLSPKQIICGSIGIVFIALVTTPILLRLFCPQPK